MRFETPEVLVLGAGGILGEAWMGGLLAGLREASGFDPRNCEHFVGTSAGSIVAAGLAALGIAKGDVVALCSPNSPEFAIVFHAVARLGAILTTMNPMNTPQELAKQLTDSKARMLVSAAALAEKAGYGEIALGTTDFADTLLVTASYVTWGRRPGLARRLPWRRADEVARLADRVFWNRVLPAGWRHTIAGVLRP